jgi:RNA polymerase sigma factor (sigma-70 family)
MDDQDRLARRFEEHRSRLEAVAYRMLGSRSEADDAVQEAWLRLSRTDSSAIDNLGGWLTTVVGRVCLDMLRSRAAHREEPLGEHVPESVADSSEHVDPEQEAVLAESVGLALLAVLDTLAPAERVAFVLHDLFGVPLAEIGAILGRTPNGAKQLAGRARKRVRAAQTPQRDTSDQTGLVTAFLAASRDGDFAALLELLDPDVELRADPAAVKAGAQPAIHGAAAVARQFAARAIQTLPRLVAETPDTIWATTRGTPPAAFRFTLRDQNITRIDIVFDAPQQRKLDSITTTT